MENYLSTFATSFVATADAACGRKRMSINESGFATVPGKSELEQAAWWVRAVATFAAEPRVEHIGVYEIKDLPVGRQAIGDAPNYHLGLARANRTRKLAFSTVKLLSTLMNAGMVAVADSELRLEPETKRGELYGHLFTRQDGDRVLMIWNRTSDDTIAVKLSDPIHGAQEYALDGTPQRIDGETLDRVVLRRGIPRIFRLR